MKIDEKIFTYFESSTSPVDKEGYLFKKGDIKTSYSKRWFVLKGNLLFYKDRAADRDLIGAIVLEGCTVQLCESEEQFAFSLVWNEPGLRTYKLAAEDQVSQESWIKALLSANHSYLALLVMDLEKKYREALVTFSNEPGNTFTMPDFTTTNAAFSSAYQSRQSTTLPSFTAPALMAAEPGLSTGPSTGPSAGPMLQAPPTTSKTPCRRSPKLWPKRSANVMPLNAPAPPMGEWLGEWLDSQEEFSKLHEEYGREVRELIANWSRRGRGADEAQEENLIDFG